MSQGEFDEPRKGKGSFTRRRFVQSTALLTGISVGGKSLIETSPIHAQESTAGIKLAQAQPAQSPPAPTPAVQPTSSIPAKPPISVEDFIKLSQVLNGIDDLEPAHAAQYLQRCVENPEVAGQLENLVQVLASLKGNRLAIEKGFQDKLRAEPAGSPFFAAAEQIIYLWYIGAFFRVNPSSPTGPRFWDYGPPQHYFRGRVWRVIDTKPPMDAPPKAALPKKAEKPVDYWAFKPRIFGA